MPTVPFNFSRDTRGVEYHGVKAPDVAGAVATGAVAMGRAVSGLGNLAGRVGIDLMEKHKRQVLAAELTRAETDYRREEREYSARLSQMSDPEEIEAARQDAVSRLSEIRETLKYSESKLSFDNALMGWRETLAGKAQDRRLQIEKAGADADADIAVTGGVENGEEDLVRHGVERKAFANAWTTKQAKLYLDEKLQAMSKTQARVAVRQFGNAPYATPEDLDRYAATLKERVNSGEDSQFRYLTEEHRAAAVAVVDRLAEGIKRDQDAGTKKAQAETADAVAGQVVDLLTKLDAGDRRASRADVEQAILDGLNSGAVKKEEAARYRRALAAGGRELDTEASRAKAQETIAAVQLIDLRYTVGGMDAETAKTELFKAYESAGPETRGHIAALFKGIQADVIQARGAAARAAVSAAKTAASITKTNRKAGYKLIDDAMKAGAFGNLDKKGLTETDKLRMEAMNKAVGKAKTPDAKAAARERILGQWQQQDAAFVTAKQAFDAWQAQHPDASGAEVEKQVQLILAAPLEDAAFQSIMRRLAGPTADRLDIEEEE